MLRPHLQPRQADFAPARRYVLLLALLITVLIGSACGNAKPHLGQPTGGAEVFQVRMAAQDLITPAFSGTGIAFDKPEGPGTSAIRAASASSSLSNSGNQYLTDWQNNRVTYTGSSAMFMPQWEAASHAPEGLSYCCYRFLAPGVGSGSGPQTLALNWDITQTVPSSAEYAVGLSKWADNSWDWFEGPADGVLTVPSFAAYTDSSGMVLAMVVVMGSRSGVLDNLAIGQPEERAGGLLLGEPPQTTSEVRLASAELPSSFDLTSGMPPIRDQGVLGSCTAFACGDGAFGFELKRLYGNSGWDFSKPLNLIGPKYLYVETGFDDPTLPPPPCPDTGRRLNKVLDYLQLRGAAADIRAPYQAPFCDNNWPAEAVTDAGLLRISGWSFIPGETGTTVNAIKTVLVEQGRPVIIGLLLDNAFMQYQSGQVWDYVGPSVGGHAMVIVGYDDARQAFKVRNSWSTFFGDQGYVLIGYSTFATNRGSGVQCFHMSVTFNQGVVDRFCQGSVVAAPSNVQASDGSFANRVRVTWSPVSGASSYKVFRAASLNGSYVQLGTTATTQFDHLLGVTTTLFYKVKAVSNNVESVFSAADSGRAGLASPTGVSASDGSFGDRVRVSWAAVPGATSYRVFAAPSASGTLSALGVSNSTSFDHLTDTTAAQFYRVRAESALGVSLNSSADAGNATLGSPLNVSASDGSLPDRVRITWSPVAGATSFKVFRAATASGTFTLLGSTSATSFDHVVPVTSQVFYRVKSVTAGGESVFSPANGGNAAVAAPLNIAASDGTLAEQVRVTWSPVAGAISYKVFRATSQNGSYVLVGTSATTQFDDTPPSGASFFYRVRTSAAPGDSALSAIDSGFRAGG